MTFFSSIVRSRALLTFALAFATSCVADSALAQEPSMQADIPFAFHEGSHAFPAGRYTIRCNHENMIVVQSTNGDSIGIEMTQGELRDKASDTGKLIFHKYGDQYFLSDVWRARESLGRKLLMSRTEKQLRGTAARRPSPESLVALNSAQP